MRSCALALLAVAAFLPVFGDVPRYLHFQGYLTDASGNPLSGTYKMTFRIYDVETGGTPLWEETQNVTVQDGYYDAVLGSVQPLNLAFDKPYWLGLEVEQDGEMVPRYRLCTAPYAFNADTVDGFHASPTPQPNALLPLDSSGKFPSSVIPAVPFADDADKLDGKDGSYYLDWNNITNRPAEFPPEPHTHDWSEITNKPTAYPTDWSLVANKPSAYPPEPHTHDWSEVTNKPQYFPTEWNQVANKPTEFPPAAHQHDASDITSGVLDLARIPHGSGSGLDADTLDGKDSIEFLTADKYMVFHGWRCIEIESGTNLIPVHCPLIGGQAKILLLSEKDLSSVKVGVNNALAGRLASGNVSSITFPERGTDGWILPHSTDIRYFHPHPASSNRWTQFSTYPYDGSSAYRIEAGHYMEWQTSQSSGLLVFDGYVHNYYNSTSGDAGKISLKYYDASNGYWVTVKSWTQTQIDLWPRESWSVQNCTIVRLENTGTNISHLRCYEIALLTDVQDLGAVSANTLKVVDVTVPQPGVRCFWLVIEASNAGRIWATAGQVLP